MNTWHDIHPYSKENLNVIIEIPQLSRIKYELDKDTGLIKVDRVLYSPMHYPANYGFTPQTLWDDGDPLDVMVLSHEPFLPGVLVEARPVAALDMNDGGDDDIKILSVPSNDPRFGSIQDISDIEPHILDEIKHFFSVYKDLQKKKVDVGEWKNAQETKKAIDRSIKQYKEKYPA